MVELSTINSSWGICLLICKNNFTSLPIGITLLNTSYPHFSFVGQHFSKFSHFSKTLRVRKHTPYDRWWGGSAASCHKHCYTLTIARSSWWRPIRKGGCFVWTLYLSCIVNWVLVSVYVCARCIIVILVCATMSFSWRMYFIILILCQFQVSGEIIVW